jgi:hypothetical protein
MVAMALLLQLVVVTRCEQLLYLQQAHNPVKKLKYRKLALRTGRPEQFATR